MVKAIETKYNGYRFRSRLEARWAVFFDALEVKYQYEPEGFDLDGEWYLPDFWIPEWNCWAEIKPEIPKFSIPGNSRIKNMKREYTLCQKLAEQSGKASLLIGGQPFVKEYVDQGYIAHEAEYQVALFCPDMVVSWRDSSPTGIELGLLLDPHDRRVSEDNFCLSHSLYGFIVRCYKEYPDFFSAPLPCRGDAKAIVEADRIYWANKYGGEHPFWFYGIARDGLIFDTDEQSRNPGLTDVEFGPSHPTPSKKLALAYAAAREARF